MNKDFVETAAQAQGIKLSPGRGEKIAAALAPLAVDDPLRAGLAFEVDPTTFVLALSANK